MGRVPIIDFELRRTISRRNKHGAKLTVTVVIIVSKTRASSIGTVRGHVRSLDWLFGREFFKKMAAAYVSSFSCRHNKSGLHFHLSVESN